MHRDTVTGVDRIFALQGSFGSHWSKKWSLSSFGLGAENLLPVQDLYRILKGGLV